MSILRPLISPKERNRQKITFSRVFVFGVFGWDMLFDNGNTDLPSVPNSMAQLRKVTGYKVQWNCTVSLTYSEFAKKMKCSILFTFQVGNLEAWFYDRSRIVTINRNHIEHQVPNVSFETQHSLSLGTDLSGTLVSSNAKISIIRFCSHDTKLQPKTYLFLFQNIRIFVLRFFF